MDFFAHDDDELNPDAVPADAFVDDEGTEDDDLFLGIGEDGEEPLDEKKEMDDLGLHLTDEAESEEI